MKLTDKMCEEFFKRLDTKTKRHIIAIAQELESATDKHPYWPKDVIHGAAIVNEEAGELTRAALNYTYEKGKYYDMHKEAIQTGAMAIRFLNNTPELKFE